MLQALFYLHVLDLKSLTGQPPKRFGDYPVKLIERIPRRRGFSRQKPCLRSQVSHSPVHARAVKSASSAPATKPSPCRPCSNT